MQIYEITRARLTENAFVSGLTKGLGQKIAPGINTGTDAQSVSAAAAQGKAAEISQPAVAALAKNQQQVWVQTLGNLMRKTGNTATGAPGVVSIADVPRTELERAMYGQINDNLARMSGRNLTDYRELPGQVDPASFQGKAVQLARQYVKDIDAALGTILDTEPTKANEQKLAALWSNLSQRLYQSANMAEFQRGGGSTAGQPGKGAQAPQINQTAQRAGLTSQQLGINYKLPATRDPQFNAVMQAMGFMDAPKAGS